MDALIGALDKLIAKKRDLKQAAMQQLLTGKQPLPGFSRANGMKHTGEIGESAIGLTFEPRRVSVSRASRAYDLRASRMALHLHATILMRKLSDAWIQTTHEIREISLSLRRPETCPDRGNAQ